MRVIKETRTYVSKSYTFNLQIYFKTINTGEYKGMRLFMFGINLKLNLFTIQTAKDFFKNVFFSIDMLV